jgi:hypothetical protein
MTFWVAGAVVGSALIGGRAASNAASTQADAANKAAQLSNDQYYQTRADQAPFREAGLTSQNKLMSLLGIGGDPNAAGYGKYGRDFSMADYQADPGYQFRLSEGQRAMAHSAGGRGGLVSGTSLKAMQDYAQNSASGEYANAFNRYQANRSNQLAPLQSLMGAGQSATNFIGQAGANNASTMGGYMTGGAAAQAAGQVGTANAITGGLGTYLNYNQGNNLVNALRSSGGGGSMAMPTGMTQQEYAIASGGY